MLAGDSVAGTLGVAPADPDRPPAPLALFAALAVFHDALTEMVEVTEVVLVGVAERHRVGVPPVGETLAVGEAPVVGDTSPLTVPPTALRRSPGEGLVRGVALVEAARSGEGEVERETARERDSAPETLTVAEKFPDAEGLIAVPLALPVPRRTLAEAVELVLTELDIELETESELVAVLQTDARGDLLTEGEGVEQADAIGE
jgi:hypothetical protein